MEKRKVGVLLKTLTDKITGRCLGKPMHRWENYTGMDLTEIGIVVRSWVD